MRTPQEHTISASQFKAHCLRLLDEVNETGRPLIITKRGKEVGRLLPPEKAHKAQKPAFGYMKGTGTIIGDIISPLDEPWDALRD